LGHQKVFKNAFLDTLWNIGAPENQRPPANIYLTYGKRRNGST